jgi:uncharacterized LabA/DUF88 family protein
MNGVNSIVVNKLSQVRVACFVDGFNFYHAVHDLRQNHLKWVDLRKLMECFIDRKVHTISDIYYFSAFAEWLTEPVKRHKAYVNALRARGVTPVLGRFKDKYVGCGDCGHRWVQHEEKQSDVNLALWMVREAFRGKYDEAFLVSQDSDLAPAVDLVREMPKHRSVKLIGPPGRAHSKELYAATNKQSKVLPFHLERCLLPAEVYDASGALVARRPAEYDPPG